MTEYVNVGVRLNSARVPTLKALKAAVAAGDAGLVFDVTDALPFNQHYGRNYRLTDLQPGWSFSVTGPDPYTSRRWYAQVRRNGDGYSVGT